MILSETEKDKLRELHKNRSIIKEQPGTAHCQRCLQLNPTSTAQNCNCPTCPCHVDFNVQALDCYGCLALFWTHQQKEDNCNCIGCPCGLPVKLGCTNEIASNYNPNANTDDGSCLIYAPGEGVFRNPGNPEPTQTPSYHTNTDQINPKWGDR